MDFRALVKRYQRLTPDDLGSPVMTLRGYARRLRVSPSLLSNFLNGKQRDSTFILRAFIRAFPQAATEVADALQIEPAEVA